MVLEGLMSPLKAERKPWQMFFYGILYSSVALIISIFLFRQYASIIMIVFTVLAAVPVIYWAIKLEEKKDLVIDSEKILIKEHGKALTFFMFLFLGFVASFTTWYLFLPEDIAVDVFKVQIETIREMNSPIAGHAVNILGNFLIIFINNLRVLLFCLLFAFFYGFGAIFILTWNASIIAVAIGDFVKSQIGNIAILIPLALMKYLIHGIPEMLAYFMGGLAGGIISVAVIRHDYKSGKFKHIIVDSLDMTFGAVLMLVVAGLLEVFVSPLIG